MIICSIKFNDLAPTSVFQNFKVLQVGVSDGSEEDGITHTMRGWHGLSFRWGGGEGEGEERKEGEKEGPPFSFPTIVPHYD
jgi:hypothetical protein